jgi:hypothetical protein
MPLSAEVGRKVGGPDRLLVQVCCRPRSDRRLDIPVNNAGMACGGLLTGTCDIAPNMSPVGRYPNARFATDEVVFPLVRVVRAWGVGRRGRVQSWKTREETDEPAAHEFSDSD